MANRWRLIILATVLIFVALHALAQGPSTAASSDCPECDALVRKVNDDYAEVNKRQAELDQSKKAGLKKEQIDMIERRLEGRRRAAEADAQELEKCLLRCRMLREPLPPIPPEIPFVRFPVPVAACPQCESHVTAANRSILFAGSEETYYLGYRSQAVRQRAWLASHPDLRDSPEYLKNYGALDFSLKGMASAETLYNFARTRFDSEMEKLAACNASVQCTQSSAFVPGVQPLPGPAGEEPKAACEACEAEALRLRSSLAFLRHNKTWLEQRLADRVQLVLKLAERPMTPEGRAQLKDLDEALKIVSGAVAQSEEEVAKDRRALDLCNQNCPPKATQQNVLPGNALGPGAPAGGTPQPVLPGGPADTGGTGTPTITPPSVTTPSSGPSSVKPPPPVVPPPPDATPLSAGGFTDRPIHPYVFTFSLGPALVTDKNAPAIGESMDNPLLHGAKSFGALRWLFSLDPPGWLWEVGGMDGSRSTSAQVPVGTPSGWAYHVTAPNGSTGVSSAGGADATLKTRYEEVHFNVAPPSALLKEEGNWKVFGEPAVGLRYSKMTYTGMISNASVPGVSSATDQRVKEYDVRGGYGLRGEYTLPNRLMGSIGAGADVMYYHAEYDGTQNNLCAVCSAVTQNFSVSTNDSRNRLDVGVSATAGLSYPVSERASIFLIGMYRYEFGAPTLVNKITPTDAAPHLGKGSREFASAQFGVAIKF